MVTSTATLAAQRVALVQPEGDGPGGGEAVGGGGAAVDDPEEAEGPIADQPADAEAPAGNEDGVAGLEHHCVRSSLEVAGRGLQRTPLPAVSD
jgi:hypothetical protein